MHGIESIYMSISTATIIEIAELARLDISADAMPALEIKLGQVLALINQLDIPDIGRVEPMAHPLEANLFLRADEISETDQRDAYLALAPETQASLYLVPKVLE